MKLGLRDKVRWNQARLLVKHIRLFCTVMADGTTRLPKRKLPYWLTRLNADSRYWGYTFLTPFVLKTCDALGIKIGDDVLQQNGVFQVCAFLRAVEEPLVAILTDIPATTESAVVDTLFSPENYSAPRVSELPVVLTPLRDQDLPGITFYLHGSMADLKYTAFSDVDDLVIIHREVWQDPERMQSAATLLASVARGYQRVDPYQHHGHWVLTEFDLLAFDQSIMPPIVLKDAVRLIGARETKFRILPDQSGFLRNVENTIKSMRRALDRARARGGINAFHLKGLAGEIAIMPAYFFQAQGEMISKPEAIRRAGELFSPFALEALAWATFVREHFDSLVDCRRVKILARIADLTCPRRYQAEALFRKYAVWVDNRYELGLRPEVFNAVEAFLVESDNLLSRLSS